MRLLAIGHSYVLAINRAVLRALAQEHGFAVTVAAPEFYHGDYRPIQLEPEPSGSPLRVVGLRTRWTRRPHLYHFTGGTLQRLLRAEEFDIVSVWEEPYIVAGWQAARTIRKYTQARLCLYSCQNINKRYPPPFSWFERWIIERADGWQASGELVKQVLIARGCESGRVEVLSLAADTSLFRRSTREDRCRMQVQLGLEPPIIGFVGRLTQEKGINVLLKALELLPASMPWSALFLGSGREQGGIESWARRRGWEERVRVKLARHEEVPQYLGAMDLLAAPSRTTPRWKEQFGRMIIEAFACGVPVIGSDSGEIPNVIGNAGIVVSEADPSAWAREIAGLLVDREKRAELARLGSNALNSSAPEF